MAALNHSLNWTTAKQRLCIFICGKFYSMKNKFCKRCIFRGESHNKAPFVVLNCCLEWSYRNIPHCCTSNTENTNNQYSEIIFFFLNDWLIDWLMNHIYHTVSTGPNTNGKIVLSKAKHIFMSVPSQALNCQRLIMLKRWAEPKTENAAFGCIRVLDICSIHWFC